MEEKLESNGCKSLSFSIIKIEFREKKQMKKMEKASFFFPQCSTDVI
jgi:hypothetical protein